MKWSSQSMTRTYKLLILATAFALVIIGFISGNNGSSIPFSAFFLALILLFILVIFWNSFDSKEETSKKFQSNPGILSHDIDKIDVGLGEFDNQNSIPNPLDSDIDIPLM